MHPDNFEDKMKDLFGSMDEQDTAQARSRKERIWEAVEPEEKRRPTQQLWWLLLLLPLFFIAGWLIKPTPTVQSPPDNVVVPIASIEQKAKSEPEVEVLSKLETQLTDTQRRLDALLLAHSDLSSELDAYKKNNTTAGLTERIEYIRQTDTIYLTRKEVDLSLIHI